MWKARQALESTCRRKHLIFNSETSAVGLTAFHCMYLLTEETNKLSLATEESLLPCPVASAPLVAWRLYYHTLSVIQRVLTLARTEARTSSDSGRGWEACKGDNDSKRRQQWSLSDLGTKRRGRKRGGSGRLDQMWGGGQLGSMPFYPMCTGPLGCESASVTQRSNLLEFCKTFLSLSPF